MTGQQKAVKEDSHKLRHGKFNKGSDKVEKMSTDSELKLQRASKCGVIKHGCEGVVVRSCEVCLCHSCYLLLRFAECCVDVSRCLLSSYVSWSHLCVLGSGLARTPPTPVLAEPESSSPRSCRVTILVAAGDEDMRILVLETDLNNEQSRTFALAHSNSTSGSCKLMSRQVLRLSGLAEPRPSAPPHPRLCQLGWCFGAVPVDCNGSPEIPNCRGLAESESCQERSRLTRPNV